MNSKKNSGRGNYMRKYGIFLNFKELPKRQMDTMNLFIDVSILIVDEVLIGLENWKAFYTDFEKKAPSYVCTAVTGGTNFF